MAEAAHALGGPAGVPSSCAPGRRSQSVPGLDRQQDHLGERGGRIDAELCRHGAPSGIRRRPPPRGNRKPVSPRLTDTLTAGSWMAEVRALTCVSALASRPPAAPGQPGAARLLRLLPTRGVCGHRQLRRPVPGGGRGRVQPLNQQPPTSRRSRDNSPCTNPVRFTTGWHRAGSACSGASFPAGEEGEELCRPQRRVGVRCIRSADGVVKRRTEPGCRGPGEVHAVRRIGVAAR